MLCILDLTPNCDNTRDLHPSMRGNVNLEVAFKEPTKKTITVLMYTASSGGISIAKVYEINRITSNRPICAAGKTEYFLFHNQVFQP